MAGLLSAVFVVALLGTRSIGSDVGVHPSTMKADGDLMCWIAFVSK